VVVTKVDADTMLHWLLDHNLLDSNRRIQRTDECVEFPVTAVPDTPPVHFTVRKQRGVIWRNRDDKPFARICREAKSWLTADQVDILPAKWEKIGDILILNLPDGLSSKERVAQLYAKILNCRAVLKNAGSIKGQMRTPHMVHLWGDHNTETVHKENGIQYKLDPMNIMFSFGNVDERIRMASVSHADEIVVDLFAGIGYFTLPLAVHCQATVHCCEINPVAYHYLLENSVLNRVTHRVHAHLGDCTIVAPSKYADRVIMGYLRSKPFLPVAFEVLRPAGGIIHYHTSCPINNFPYEPLAVVASAATNKGHNVRLLQAKIVKSYAPGIVHGVLDIAIT